MIRAAPSPHAKVGQELHHTKNPSYSHLWWHSFWREEVAIHISKWSTSLSVSQRDGRSKDEIEQKKTDDDGMSINLKNLQSIDGQTQMFFKEYGLCFWEDNRQLDSSVETWSASTLIWSGSIPTNTNFFFLCCKKIIKKNLIIFRIVLQW